MRFIFRMLAVCLCVLLIGGIASAEEKKIKAGFIYVGPVGDLGWSHAHDVGRKFAESKLPWLESVFIESVPEAVDLGAPQELVARMLPEQLQRRLGCGRHKAHFQIMPAQIQIEP